MYLAIKEIQVLYHLYSPENALGHHKSLNSFFS